MNNLAWITDPHLNFLDQEAVYSFCAALAQEKADAFLITGDIGEAPNVAVYLNILDNHLGRPIYFVLGNHDFYRGSIAQVRAEHPATLSGLPQSALAAAGGGHSAQRRHVSDRP